MFSYIEAGDFIVPDENTIEYFSLSENIQDIPLTEDLLTEMAFYDSMAEDAARGDGI